MARKYRRKANGQFAGGGGSVSQGRGGVAKRAISNAKKNLRLTAALTRRAGRAGLSELRPSTARRRGNAIRKASTFERY